MRVTKIVLSKDNPNTEKVRLFFEKLIERKRIRGEYIREKLKSNNKTNENRNEN
jgi:hypothetical protein